MIFDSPVLSSAANNLLYQQRQALARVLAEDHGETAAAFMAAQIAASMLTLRRGSVRSRRHQRHRASYSADTFRTELREHFRHGKPVAVTEFGTRAYQGGGRMGAGKGVPRDGDPIRTPVTLQESG
ncbi:hypothetical protein [Streptomyces sp. RKAG293]|uniref:hypothetical protein n=1 Tax=Streptomyces sp. RKAG293 TaxID=2893403 RepID=UPI0020338DF7|nr:hypothetical protein [Streptomyces sp. RKAG293]MCM2423814.1 hypothetical protein [Streptomyces sp. RKAG293]